MTQRFIKTKPSFLEAGLPCASLSAECQRDNNARQRPPQNRLHIWWARRAPTVCRVAILSALLPHDVNLDPALLPPAVPEPTDADLEELPAKMRPHRAFFEKLLADVPPTPLTTAHGRLLRALGITGDGNAAYLRLAMRDEASAGKAKIPLPDALVFRHPPAFAVSPSAELLRDIQAKIRQSLSLGDSPIIVLDFMAGGGAIPLEAVRFGAKVYANDLNPVAALVLKATLEYPARFGRQLVDYLRGSALKINATVRERLSRLFSAESPEEWWPHIGEEQRRKLRTKQVTDIGPAGPAITRDYLWLRTIPCPKCGLNIPLSTNFHIVTEKGDPDASVAVFPEVPLSKYAKVFSQSQTGEAWIPRCFPAFGVPDCERTSADLLSRRGDRLHVSCGGPGKVGGLPLAAFGR